MSARHVEDARVAEPKSGLPSEQAGPESGVLASYATKLLAPLGSMRAYANSVPPEAYNSVAVSRTSRTRAGAI